MADTVEPLFYGLPNNNVLLYLLYKDFQTTVKPPYPVYGAPEVPTTKLWKWGNCKKNNLVSMLFWEWKLYFSTQLSRYRRKKTYFSCNFMSASILISQQFLMECIKTLFLTICFFNDMDGLCTILSCISYKLYEKLWWYMKLKCYIYIMYKDVKEKTYQG